MKKKKLLVEYEYDFELFGITSSVRPHRLAWEINQLMKSRLVKKEDLIIHYKSGEEKSYVVFEYETPLNTLKLFRNRPNEANTDNIRITLASEFTHFDYILLIKSIENVFGNNLPASLKKIPCIEYVAEIPLEQLKSKENFIF